MQNKREKLLLSVAFLTVAILIGDRLVLGPLVNSWKIRNDKIAKLERDIAKGKTLLPRLEPSIKNGGNM